VQTIFIAISASIYFQNLYRLRSYLLKANLTTAVFYAYHTFVLFLPQLW